MADHERYLGEAIDIAHENVARGGRPYGAVIVREGVVLARSANLITQTNDPTAHAELLALRDAGIALGRADLDDCIVYASGRPCPMCHAAMRLANVREAYFAFTAEHAAAHGAARAELYAELCLPLADQPMQVRHLPMIAADDPYVAWAARNA